MRLLVYGDSNSWGFPPDGGGLRFDTATRWPCVAAEKLGVELVEEALPGRTTVHDDPEMLGSTMNGLVYLPVALKSHCPVDLLVIMLGTNDFKARFGPESAAIAGNMGRLVTLARQVGGGRGPWHTAPAPVIAVIVPPPLPEIVDDLTWDRCAEWRGGRAASLGLADALTGIAARMDFPILDAGQVVAGSRDDPIHLDGTAHVALGQAVARWLAPLAGPGGRLRQKDTKAMAR